jgi:hypothetical protein
MDDYLTDGEYVDLLIRGRIRLNEVVNGTGDSITTKEDRLVSINVGICDYQLTTYEIALHPPYWPKIKTMKHRAANHRCPLDSRVNSDLSGCFYHCLFFQKKLKNIDKIKDLYDTTILNFGKVGTL